MPYRVHAPVSPAVADAVECCSRGADAGHDGPAECLEGRFATRRADVDDDIAGC